MSVSQINALITLIEDPDEVIFEQVKHELESCGERALPFLEQYWEYDHFGELFRNRIDTLIQTIRFRTLCQQFKDWKESENPGLLDGMLLVNRFQYPNFDETELRYTISKFRQEIWLELNDDLTALEVVRIFNHMLFEVYGFQGNKQNHTAAQNSFISDVLNTKKGNPISLAVLYQLLANSLDIPIYGVNLPSHFVLCYLDNLAVPSGSLENRDYGVLFYINPFSEGTVINADEIDEFLGHLDIPQRPAYYGPCSNVTIINRMLNNLVYAFGQAGKDNKVQELRQLQEILNVVF